MKTRSSSWAATTGLSLIVGAAYVAAGKIGLMAALPPGYISVIWLSSGIALAAVLRIGYRIWPGIWLGSFLLNTWVTAEHSPLSLAFLAATCGLAAGSTLQALIGGFLLRRLIGPDDLFARAKNVFKFVGIEALCVLIAPTVGVTSLCLAGLNRWDQYFYGWSTWWLGDFVGIVMITPLLMKWTERPWFSRRSWPPRRLLEATSLLLLLLATGGFIFGGASPPSRANQPLDHLLIPLLLWGAFRFSQRSLFTAIFLFSILAIWGTSLGFGPFHRKSFHDSLLLLQSFLGVINVTALILSAVLNERKIAEEALQEANNTLDRRVVERTEELERSNTMRRVAEEEKIKALKESDRLKDEFLSIISHELRTPLNAITGFGSILEDELAGPLNPQQHASVDKILEGSERMLELIGNLLDITRMKAGKFELGFEMMSYTSLVQEVISFFAPLAGKKGIRVKSEIQVPGQVRLDGQRIKQVLLNLLDNAVKFSPPGELVFVKAWMEGDELITEVQDRGIGIASEDIEKLFSPFKQLDMSSTRKSGGTGLGLSISKGIVEAHGGKIVAFSPGLEKGSTFRFTIPTRRITCEESAH